MTACAAGRTLQRNIESARPAYSATLRSYTTSQDATSQAADPTKRTLLHVGRRNHITFEGLRLMSHKLAEGSRIVAVVKIIKGSDRKINYGSRKPVIDETIADAGTPLEVRWFSNSFVELPVNR